MLVDNKAAVRGVDASRGHVSALFTAAAGALVEPRCEWTAPGGSRSRTMGRETQAPAVPPPNPQCHPPIEVSKALPPPNTYDSARMAFKSRFEPKNLAFNVGHHDPPNHFTNARLAVERQFIGMRRCCCRHNQVAYPEASS